MRPARVLLPLMLAAMAPLVAACAGEEQRASLRPPCPAGKLCLEYGNGAEPGTLDPHVSSGDWESNIIGEMMVGLTESDQEGKAVPGMATHWDVSPDGLTWTFHLRDALWSDGVPVTADDFVFGLRRIQDPKLAAGQASQIYAIKNAALVNAGKLPLEALGVRAIDDRTLEIQLEHPWPVLPDYTNGVLMAPAPRHAVEKFGDAWVQPANYVGNGSYIVKSWALGDKIVLEKNPRYYDAAKVCIDQISYYPTVDAVSAERRVKNGELDLNNNIVSNRLARMREPGQMPEYVRFHPYVGVTYLSFNLVDVPALKDVRVRQAISMAIDREFITEKLLRGGQTPAYSYVPPGMVGYEQTAKVPWAGWSLERRQAEARRLLAQAGFGPDRPLRLEFKYRNGADPILYLTAVQADMKAIGVQADLMVNETQVAYQAYDVKDFQVGDMGWGGGTDPYGFLYLWRRDTGQQNYPGYSNPRYDALLDQANNEPDLARRGQLLAQAEQLVLNDAPIVPMYYLARRALVHPDITGWVNNAVDTHKARFLCFRNAEARRAGRTG